MLIEIWSDIACPFCYLGLTKLQRAIQNKGLENEVQIELRTFLLNPGLKTDLSKSISQYLHEHKQIPLEQIEAMNDRIVSQGKAFGLDFQMQQIKVANTIKAHLLLHEAQEIGLRGVPYFIFDRKVAIHGAREVEAFEQALMA